MRPHVNICPFLACAMAAGVILSACSGSVSIESKPKIRQATKVETSGSAITEIEEICYGGLVYIVNGRGGMAPKMVDSSAPMGDSAATYVARCK